MDKTVNFRRSGTKKKGISSGSDTSSQVGFDTHQLNQLLQSLVPVGDTKIANLRGKDKENYSKVVRIVENTVGTDQYRYVLEAFNSHFDANSLMEPGTVKAYCVGCSAITSMSNSFPACTPLCAGNAPSSDQSSCQFKTFLARKVDTGFVLVLLNPTDTGTEGGRGLVFIDEKYVVNDIPPFSNSELGTLRSYGITEIKVFSHDSSMRNYRYVGERPFSIAEFSEPKATNRKVVQEQSTDNLWLGGGIGLLLLFLLIAAFMYKRRTR